MGRTAFVGVVRVDCQEGLDFLVLLGGHSVAVINGDILLIVIAYYCAPVCVNVGQCGCGLMSLHCILLLVG